MQVIPGTHAVDRSAHVLKKVLAMSTLSVGFALRQTLPPNAIVTLLRVGAQSL